MLAIRPGERAAIRTHAILLTSVIAVSLSLAGCGGTRTVPIRISYKPSALADLAPLGRAVAVAPLRDKRSRAGGVVGTRAHFVGSVDHFSLEKPGVAASVTEVLRGYFRERKARVEAAPRWDGRPESLREFRAELVVTGEVEDLWLESTDRAAWGETEGRVHLTLFVGGVRTGKVVRRTIRFQPEEMDLLFKEERELEEFLGGSLSEALDRILPGMIREALRP